MEQATRQTLEIFVEKAQRLREKSFVKYLLENKLEFHMSFHEGDEQIQTQQLTPDAEAVEAVVTTLRILIQPRDRVSLYDLASVLNDPAVSKGWKEEYTLVRDHIVHYLDSFPRLIQIKDEGNVITNREIMETFIYGDIAHINPDKRAKFQLWKQVPPLFEMLHFYFVNILVDVLRAIFRVDFISKQELQGVPITNAAKPRSIFLQNAKLRQMKKATRNTSEENFPE